MLNNKRVLVAGATGYLGGYVAREFKARGWRVRALARSENRIRVIGREVDEVVLGEVTRPESISGSCDDIDLVFSSIGITRQKDGLTYMDVDYQGNVNLLREAQRAGVSKFMYISVFNAGVMQDLRAVQAKILFEMELKGSGLNYTIIRPNGFFSDMREYLRMAERGRCYVFGSGEYRINPIHRSDLASACADAAIAGKQEIDVGGPDVFTHNQIVWLAFKARAKPLKITHVPLWLRDIALAGLRRFTSVQTYGPLEFFMNVLTMDMVAPKAGEYRLETFFKGEPTYSL